MGQAKQRGTTQERINAAKARIDSLRPKAIICNQCGHEITEIVDLNTHRMDGVDAAFAGLCQQCGRSTYAIKGRPEAVEALKRVMTEAMGEAPLMGSQ